MKIYQIVPALNYGDAIGNDVIAIKHIIEDMKIPTAVYTGVISPKITEPDTYTISEMPKIREDDIIIYHMGSASSLNMMVSKLNCRKIMIYHNITPYEFFRIDNITATESCRKGLEDMVEMRGCFNSYLADSEFNKSDMIKMGYKENQIEVIPVVIPFDDYKQKPNSAMVAKLSDDITNIVFVGRIAPNKKHEDIIRTFDYYKKNINPKSRLILVGSANLNGMYYGNIKSYIDELGTKDIIFPGHISFAEILAIYKTADVFLCLSEHEGFCVPLLEAMTFDVPIIAYNAGAIPETMGGSGVVVDNKDPVFLSKVIHGVVTDEKMKNDIINMQRKRLEDFAFDKIKNKFQSYLRKFIEDFPPRSPDDNEKNARDLYNLVDDNMRKAGKTLDFSQDTLIHRIKSNPNELNVTELLNCNYSNKSLVEIVYLARYNSLPDKESCAFWENEAKNCNRTDFIKKLISSTVDSNERKNSGMKVLYNPFTTAVLKTVDELSENIIEGGAEPA